MPRAEWYKTRKAAGLCVRCGAVPHRLDTLECGPCAEKRRAHQNAHQKEANRRAAGLCVRCGGVRTDAKMNCGPCRETIRAYQAGLIKRRYKGTCSECGSLIGKKDGFFRKCDACQLEQKRRTARTRAWRLLGIPVTLEEYDRVFALQDGRCAICNRVRKHDDFRFHLDHDHKFGHVRGILCLPCNTMLGMANDSPARLRAAAQYIEAHGPQLKLAK